MGALHCAQEILIWVNELQKKHGPTFCIWFGKDLAVLFTDPDDIRQILSNNTLLTKSSNYQLMEEWLGKGLLTSGGSEWRRRRKLLTPAFHFKILSEFKEPMEENCRILVSKLRERADGKQFDIYPYITLFTLDVICETAMGIKKHAQMENESKYVQAIRDIFRILHKQQFSFWQRFNVFFNLTKAGKERKAVIKILHNETNRVIRIRRQMLQESNITTTTIRKEEKKLEGIGGKRRLAFLDMLLISQMEGMDLSDQEIREEVDTFMVEGYDTTGSAIAFAIYLLSQHADVQQRAYEEIVSLEDEDDKYLEAVIKESLRLYPSVPFFSRKTTEDTQIGNMTIPKGVAIASVAYMVHRDEKNFPNPEKFDPERFLSSGEKDIHPFAFIAFSAGPRNCIGQKFAMLELKCSLSWILRHFELLPAKNFKPNLRAELVIKSGNGIQVRLRERQVL